MTVDSYWRRVDPEAVRDLDPPELRDFVPFYFDDRFVVEVQSRTTVMGRDTGSLLCGLLRLGADDDADDYAAWLAVRGADGVEGDALIGVLPPEEVVVVAEFLARIDPVAWMRRFRADLAAGADAMGYQHPFDDARAEAVVTDAQDVAALFGLAAAAGEAVIVMVVV
jgi:hypothetical protein